MALSSAFGTIALASLLIAICEALKRLARRQSENNGLLGCLVACCITCVLDYLEFLTSFALAYSALTGGSFCSSGRTFLGHCTRHGFLRVIAVDYLAQMTLSFGALVLGLLVAALTAGAVDVGV